MSVDGALGGGGECIAPLAAYRKSAERRDPTISWDAGKTPETGKVVRIRKLADFVDLISIGTLRNNRGSQPIVHLGTGHWKLPSHHTKHQSDTLDEDRTRYRKSSSGLPIIITTIVIVSSVKGGLTPGSSQSRRKKKLLRPLLLNAWGPVKDSLPRHQVGGRIGDGLDLDQSKSHISEVSCKVSQQSILPPDSTRIQSKSIKGSLTC